MSREGGNETNGPAKSVVGEKEGGEGGEKERWAAQGREEDEGRTEGRRGRKTPTDDEVESRS